VRKKLHKRRNKHHLVPKMRTKEPINLKANVLLIGIERHCAWHKLFKTLTLVEAIRLLIRVYQAKNHETIERLEEEYLYFGGRNGTSRKSRSSSH